MNCPRCLKILEDTTVPQKLHAEEALNMMLVRYCLKAFQYLYTKEVKNWSQLDNSPSCTFSSF